MDRRPRRYLDLRGIAAAAMIYVVAARGLATCPALQDTAVLHGRSLQGSGH